MTNEKKGVTHDGNALLPHPDALSQTQPQCATEAGRLQAPRRRADTLLAQVHHSHDEVIRVTIREIAGKQRVDIRAWWRDESGVWHPSSKGLALYPRQVPELVNGLMRAATSVSQNGGA